MGNITSIRSRIIVKELSNTFQHANIACRQLGIDYLWVDSLCIIQDSVSDWNDESVLMSQIYESSVCNLAATTARDGKDGLVFPRDPLFKPIRIRTNGVHGEQ
jgi:hypothetical protein